MMQHTARLLAFYFLLGACLPHSDFGQLAKLRLLWAHAELHHVELAAQGRDFSLMEFLWMHFVDPESHHHQGHDDDHQLPLQSISSDLVFISLHWPERPLGAALVWDLRCPHHPHLLADDFRDRIFQPPAC